MVAVYLMFYCSTMRCAMLPPRFVYLKALRWKLMLGGFVVFVAFALAQALLAEAHWDRLSRVLFVVAVAGWVVGAGGVILHVYVLYKLWYFPPERPR
jgi:hypothetical protein